MESISDDYKIHDRFINLAVLQEKAWSALRKINQYDLNGSIKLILKF